MFKGSLSTFAWKSEENYGNLKWQSGQSLG